MNTLKNKSYRHFDYTYRYDSVPTYFDTLENREISGIGSNLYTDTPYVSHVVKQGDTLDSLALHYYNNPTYWWVIAYYNNIQDPFIELIDRYRVLSIPNIALIQFGKERA